MGMPPEPRRGLYSRVLGIFGLIVLALLIAGALLTVYAVARRGKSQPMSLHVTGAGPDKRISDVTAYRVRVWGKVGKELSGLRSLELESLLDFDKLGMEHMDYGSVVDFLGYRIEHGYKASASKAYPINVSRYMAVATGSSGLCGHSHHLSMYSWTDARGSHSYIENGCLCRFDMEYAAFPNWQQAFTYGVVYNNRVHLVPVQIYDDGFRAEGEFYRRK